MIRLATGGVPCDLHETILGRVALVPLPAQERAAAIRVLQQPPSADEDFHGYAALLTPAHSLVPVQGVPTVNQCDVAHLAHGDVVSIDRRGSVRTLYRRGSKSNSLFATERCNSLCVMCSQPPRDVDDSGRVEELIRLVDLIDPETEELGITGGEPTLLGKGLLRVIDECRRRLPQTSLHLLSNGRLFSRRDYALALAKVHHPDLMVGVPVYSDVDWQHDYVVQDMAPLTRPC